jgi:hypothetical protein
MLVAKDWEEEDADLFMKKQWVQGVGGPMQKDRKERYRFSTRRKRGDMKFEKHVYEGHLCTIAGWIADVEDSQLEEVKIAGDDLSTFREDLS